jgi:hypothetical protein
MGLVLKHSSQVSSCWLYTHDNFEDEVFTENAQDWDEVIARMVDTKMTKFKEMSLDEQAIILEQSTQGALRSREEIIAVKVEEAPQVVAKVAEAPQVAAEIAKIPRATPVQDIIFFEAQDAR